MYIIHFHHYVKVNFYMHFICDEISFDDEKDSIRDIELTIKLNYPKQLHYKLYLRAMQCYSKLGKQHLVEKTISEMNEIIDNPDYIALTMKGTS